LLGPAPGRDFILEAGLHVRGEGLVRDAVRLLPLLPWRRDGRTPPRRTAGEKPDHREDDRRHEGEAEAHDGGGDRSPDPWVPNLPGLLDDRRVGPDELGAYERRGRPDLERRERAEPVAVDRAL